MHRPGYVVKYKRGSKVEGIERGSFGVVRSSEGTTNRLTVELSDGSTIAYGPKRVYGVNVYREISREFATGDRLQFSGPNKDLEISNRDTGTITRREPDHLTVLMDGKEQRSVSFSPAEFRQVDHGFAVTSHGAQGLTTGRVIANIDTDSNRSLINTRLAYVATLESPKARGPTWATLRPWPETCHRSRQACTQRMCTARTLQYLHWLGKG
jgi:hypothetical protein